MRSKTYCSMSSLPTVNSNGSRPPLQEQSKEEKRIWGRAVVVKGERADETSNKHFKRPESYLVTLARRVANLSSELGS